MNAHTAISMGLACVGVFILIVGIGWWLNNQLVHARDRRDRHEWDETLAELQVPASYDGETYEWVYAEDGQPLPYYEWPPEGEAEKFFLEDVEYDPAADADAFIKRMHADTEAFLARITADG